MVFQKCFEVSSIPDPYFFSYHGKLEEMMKSLPFYWGFYIFFMVFLHTKVGTQEISTDNLPFNAQEHIRREEGGIIVHKHFTTFTNVINTKAYY